tara:strand:- start:156 stop:770 length:615 start_codon:yes stop_codon:yes gene_type:complete
MKPTVIGIAGGTGSGKTFLTKKILEMSVTKDIVVIEQDAYYKDLSHMPYEKRVKQNFDHPDSIDLDLFESQLLQLIKGETVNIPTYDFSKHIRANKTKEITYSSIIIVEGIFVLHYLNLRKLCTVRIFMATPEKVRFQRRMARDIEERGRTPESVKLQYESTVLPMHEKYIEPSKNHADYLIQGEYDLKDVITMINAKTNTNKL